MKDNVYGHLSVKYKVRNGFLIMYKNSHKRNHHVFLYNCSWELLVLHLPLTNRKY